MQPQNTNNQLNNSSYDDLVTMPADVLDAQPVVLPEQIDDTQSISMKHRRTVLLTAISPVVIACTLVTLFSLHQYSLHRATSTAPSISPSNQVDQNALPILKTNTAKFRSADSVAIEGKTILGGGLVITPSRAPSASIAGQIYYDVQTNQLRLSDGSTFRNVVTNDSTKTICYVGANCGFLQAGDVAGLTLPQGLAPTDTPTFAGLTLTGGLSVANGGTGAASFISNAVVLGNGTGQLISSNPASAGQLLVADSTGKPEFVTVTGAIGVDANGLTTLNADTVGATQLTSSGVVAGSYGSNATYPIITVDQDGRISNVSLGGLPGGGIGIASVNSLVGALTIQGTVNQIAVVSGGSTITLSTPQDIATTSSPTFAALTVTGTATAGAFSGNGSLLTNLNGTNITSGTVSNNRLVGSGTLNVTAGTGLSGGGSIALGASGTLNVVYGSTATSAVAGNTVLNCPSGTGNLSGGGTAITLGIGGTCGNISTVNNPNFSTSVASPQHIFTGAGSNGTLQVASLGQATTYTLPDPGGSSASICLTTGNCVGLAGGLSGAGTAGKLAKFTSGSNLADSILSESGSVLTDSGSLVIQGSSSLTLGTASSATGSVAFKNSTNANTLTLQSGASGSNFSLTLPTADGSTGNCLTTNGAGILAFASCLSGAGGGSGGVTSLDGLSGVLTINNSSGSGSAITINDATTAAKGIASFSSTNFTVSSGAVNTIQNINTTASPTFAGQTLTGLNTAGIVTNTSGGVIGTVAAVPIGNGGTNAATSQSAINNLSQLTTNGDILYYDGTNSTRLARGSNGQCLLSNGTTILWSTCTGAGGVSAIGTIDSQTKSANGAVISGSNLVLQTADATNPGLVSVGSQTIGGAKTFNGLITGQLGLTVSGAAISLNDSSSFNTTINGGTSTGTVTVGNAAAGIVAVQSGTSIALNSGTLTTSAATISIFDTTATTVTALQASTSTIIGAVTGSTYIRNPNLQVGNTGPAFFTGAGVAGLTVQSATQSAGSTNSGTVSFTSGFVTGATSNTGNVTLKSGNSNTSGNSGTVSITTGNATSGNSGNLTVDIGTASGTKGTITIGATNASALTLGRSGLTTTNSGSLTAAELLTANLGLTVSGAAISLNNSSNFNTNINAGTSTGAVNIGNSLAGAITLQSGANIVLGTSDTTGTLLVLDNKTGAGDPTGVSGGMYYNSSAGKFRCYQAGAWGDCAGSSTGVTAVGAIDTQTKSANGAVISGSSIYLQTADASNPGLVSTGTQTFAGDKTFTGLVTGQLGLTASGASINLNASSNFNTNINTGTSSGTTNIGNASASVNLQGTTTVANGQSINVGSYGTETGQLYVSGAIPAGSLNTIATGATSLSRLTTQGRYVYVGATASASVQIRTYDASVPSALASVTNYSTSYNNNAQGIAVQGQFAYIAAGGDDKLVIANISNPNSYSTVAASSTNGPPSGPIAAAGNYVYVIEGSNIETFNVSNTASITKTLVAASGTLRSLIIQGGYLYAASGDNLQIFSLANPGTPSSVGTVSIGAGNVAQDVKVNGRYAYVVTSTGNTINIIDIKNPASPSSVGSLGLTASGAPSGIVVSGQYAYIANAGTANVIQIVDVSTPSSPSSIGTIAAGSSIKDVAVVGRYLYAIDSSSNLKSFDIGGAYIQQLQVGSVETTALTVKDLTIMNGIRVAGAIDVSGSSHFLSDVSVGGLIVGNAGLTLTGATISLNDSSNFNTNINSGTSTGTISIGNAAAGQLSLQSGANIVLGISDTTGTLLVLDTKTGAGDPTGTDGAMYYNSNAKTFRCYQSGAWRSCIGGLVAANTSVPGGNTLANSTTATNLSSNYSILANDCQPGKVYRVTASGVYSTTGTPNLTLNLNFGTTTVVTTGTNATANGVTNQPWRVSAQVTCDTTGASGTVEGQGFATLSTAATTAQTIGMGNTGTITLDTTTGQTLQLNAQWGTASSSNTITLRQLVVEALSP